MKLRNYIFVPLLLALTSSAFAYAPLGVKDYLALRRKAATGVPIETLKANAGSYIGKVFEIRGAMSGHFKIKDVNSIIIDSHAAGSYSVSVDAPPTDSLGSELACLVKVGEKSTCSLSDLKLVAFTYLADVERLEEAARKAAEAQAAEAKAAQAESQPASRGEEQRGASPRTITMEQYVSAYKAAVKRFNRKLTDRQADTIARSIVGFSLRYKLDARLVCAVILAESHFRIEATSPVGAQGLGQLMPSTAAGLGVDNAYDPVSNIYGSVRYIKGMLDRMSGNKEWNSLTWYDLALALAAYNAGPGAVKKHGGVPPYRETQNYVRRVTSIYKQLCGVK